MSPKRPEDDAAPNEQQPARLPLHKVVANSLREMIVEGRLNPGERINENELAAKLNVSRTPLRDALKILQSEGLIVHRPHRGTRVARITPGHTAELFEALAVIEGSCGAMAASRMDDEQLRQFTDLHQQMLALYEQDDLAGYFELNDQIHRAFVELSGNSILAEMHCRQIASAKRIRFTAIRFKERWDQSVAEHKAILQALKERDAKKVGMLIERHVRRTGEFVRQHLDQIMAGHQDSGESGDR